MGLSRIIKRQIFRVNMRILFFFLLFLALVGTWGISDLGEFLFQAREGPSALLADVNFTNPELRANANLAAFYQWTKEDPLFTSPDFDAQGFLEIIKALEINEKAIVSHLGSNNPLFPIAFFRDVAEVDRLHREFLSSPSLKRAKELISAYYMTTDDYEEARQNLLKDIQDNNLPEHFNIVGINVSTTPKVMAEDIGRLGENSEELRNEIRRRKDCLELGAACRRPAFLFVKPEIQDDRDRFFSKDILARDILLPLFDKDIPLFGPYLVSTPCFGWGPDFTHITYPFYVFETEDSRLSFTAKKDLSVQFSKLATTNYYRRVQKDFVPDTPFRKKGMNWVPQLETHTYMCIDLSYQSTLAALDRLYRGFKGMPLYGNFLTRDDLPGKVREHLKEGDILERRFFESRFPSEVDAANLSEYYAYTYREIGEWVRNRKYRGKPWPMELTKKRDEFLNRYLGYKRKLSNVHKVLGAASASLSSFRITGVLYGVKDKGYFYVVRGIYGMVYMPFSPSFYRLTKPLVYLERKGVAGAVGFDGFLINYQQALKKYTAEEIKKWEVVQTETLAEDLARFKQE